MPYVTVEEEVWVDLDSFDTEDLIEELRSRNHTALPTDPEDIDRYEAEFLRSLLDEYRAQHTGNPAGVMLWALDKKLADRR